MRLLIGSRWLKRDRPIRLAVLDSEDDRQQENDGQEHENAGEDPALRNAGQRFDGANVTITLVVVLDGGERFSLAQTCFGGKDRSALQCEFCTVNHFTARNRSSFKILTADGQSGVSL